MIPGGINRGVNDVVSVPPRRQRSGRARRETARYDSNPGGFGDILTMLLVDRRVLADLPH